MKISKLKITPFLAICFISVNLFAQSSDSSKLFIDLNKSSFGFDGTSNIHDYSVNANIVNGYIVIENVLSDSIDSVDSIKIVKSFISIPVRNMKSKKGKRLEKLMYKALKEKDFPTIDYLLIDTKPVTLSKNENGFLTVSTHGKVTIAGFEKEIDVELKIAIESGNVIRITGEKDLLMKDFGVKRPMLMFKTIRTKDEITIKFDLVFSNTNK